MHLKRTSFRSLQNPLALPPLAATTVWPSTISTAIIEDADTTKLLQTKRIRVQGKTT